MAKKVQSMDELFKGRHFEREDLFARMSGEVRDAALSRQQLAFALNRRGFGAGSGERAVAPGAGQHEA